MGGGVEREGGRERMRLRMEEEEEEEGICATVERREPESECALGWDAVPPRSSPLY